MEAKIWFVRGVMLLMFVLPGLMSLWVGVRGSRWFFESRSSSYVLRHMGRTGARVLYIILGLLLLGCGVLFVLDPLGVSASMHGTETRVGQ